MFIPILCSFIHSYTLNTFSHCSFLFYAHFTFVQTEYFLLNVLHCSMLIYTFVHIEHFCSFLIPILCSFYIRTYLIFFAQCSSLFYAHFTFVHSEHFSSMFFPNLCSFYICTDWQFLLNALPLSYLTSICTVCHDFFIPRLLVEQNVGIQEPGAIVCKLSTNKY